MASEKQVAANRINGALGGVKTDEGKAVSRWNALKHGILKEIVSDYEQGFHESVVESLTDYFRPADFLEHMFVDRLGISYLRLHRAAKAESEYMRSVLNPRRVVVRNLLDNLDFSEETVVNEGYVPRITQDAVEQLLGVYLRYEMTIENRMYKALHELQRLQVARRGEPVAAPITIEVNSSGSEG